jgi:AraC-like DNA-binding protein
MSGDEHARVPPAVPRRAAGPDDVAGGAHLVGHDSPSRFTREYRRLFGVPPRQDALRLRAVDTRHPS